MSLAEMKQMLLCCCDEIVESVPYLTEIDTLIGDGDHGRGMYHGFTEMRHVLLTQNFNHCAQMLRECGMTLLKCMGGASGVLFGTLFICGSEAVPDSDSIDCHDFSKFILAGAEAVQRRGKTKLGQKTMVDALIPAARAMCLTSETDCCFRELLLEGWNAAKSGAAATGQMCASVGRSKGFREQSLGVMDPGAVSVSKLFEGFYKYISAVRPMNASN